MNPEAPESPLPRGCRPRLAPGVRRQTDKVSGRPALLFPEGVLLLNPTGTAVVELCDGRHALEDIVSALAARFGAPAERVGADVAEYLLRLRRKGIIELAVEEASHE
jgi:pyrroloquinoline quinone biosynthesis protein D